MWISIIKTSNGLSINGNKLPSLFFNHNVSTLYSKNINANFRKYYLIPCPITKFGIIAHVILIIAHVYPVIAHVLPLAAHCSRLIAHVLASLLWTDVPLEEKYPTFDTSIIFQAVVRLSGRRFNNLFFCNHQISLKKIINSLSSSTW